MGQLAKFITDDRTGLKYELCGDYYIIAGEDEPEREPIGVWGQRHLKHIIKHCKPFYNKMLGEHTLYDYLLQIDEMLKKCSLSWLKGWLFKKVFPNNSKRIIKLSGLAR